MPNSQIVPVSRPVVSEDEQQFRESLYPKVKTIKDRNVLCTSCNSSVKELVLKGKPAVHPFMDTLLCEKCHSFFGDGEFSVDEDGSDKYCRWCGQGGTLFLCSRCNAGFCKKCIKRNLPRSALAEVEKDDWQCYCCNVKPLYELRAHCWAALKYSETIKPKEPEQTSNKKRKHTSADSDNEDDEDDDEKPKKRRMSSRKAGLDDSKSSKSSKKDKDDDNEEDDVCEPVEKADEDERRTKKKKVKQYRVLVNKFSDLLDDTIKIAHLLKRKCLDYQDKKVKVKVLRSTQAVDEFVQKYETLGSSVEDSVKKLREGMKEYVTEWKKALDEIEQHEINKDNTGLENGLNSPKKSDLEESMDVSKDEAKDEQEDKSIVEGESMEVDKEETNIESSSDARVEGEENDSKDKRVEGEISESSKEEKIEESSKEKKAEEESEGGKEKTVEEQSEGSKEKRIEGKEVKGSEGDAKEKDETSELDSTNRELENGEGDNHSTSDKPSTTPTKKASETTDTVEKVVE